jgi:hypothetical protein
MPVKSLNSSVLKWPDGKEVDTAVRAWTKELVSTHPNLIKVGYFGSYARGDWGVGSDLDLIAVVTDAQEPFERRSATWDMESFPVPAHALVYTTHEWESLHRSGTRFARMLASDTVWVYAVP